MQCFSWWHLFQTKESAKCTFATRKTCTFACVTSQKQKPKQLKKLHGNVSRKIQGHMQKFGSFRVAKKISLKVT